VYELKIDTAVIPAIYNFGVTGVSLSNDIINAFHAFRRL